MKIPPNKSASVAAILGVAGIVAGFALLCPVGAMAQSAVQPVSLVGLAASAQGLSQVDPTAVPRVGGTYWWVLPGGSAAPTPCLPLDFSGPIFQISTNEFLLDESGGEVSPRRFGLPANPTDAQVVAAANDEVQLLVGLITQIQAAEVNPQTLAPATTMDLSAKPMGSGGGGFSPDYSTANGPYLTLAPTGTNQFLITVWNDTGPANYELWHTPVLANPEYPWTALYGGSTGQTNFVVDIGPFQTGFYRTIWDTNSVPLWQAADPNNPGAGILTVFIDSPTNGAVIQ